MNLSLFVSGWKICNRVRAVLKVSLVLLIYILRYNLKTRALEFKLKFKVIYIFQCLTNLFVYLLFVDSGRIFVSLYLDDFS